MARRDHRAVRARAGAAALALALALAFPAAALVAEAGGFGQPDLVVLDITWTPAAPEAGDSVTFTAKVRNLGNESAGGFAVRFRVGNLTVSTEAVAGLAGGANVTVTSDAWSAREGEHTVQALADVHDEVAESNEANNARHELLLVAPAPQPDLLVTDITWSPAAPAAGDATTFTAKVRNAGNASAGAFVVRFVLDNVTLSTESVDGLAAGANVSVSSDPWTAVQGNHTIEAIADADGQVGESDEGNNERQETVAVAGAPKPDLLVHDITWSPQDPSAGDATVFTATVRNAGNASAGPSALRFLLDNATLGTVPVPELAAGANVSVRSDAWTAEAGLHSIEAVADVEGEVAESNEGNNRREETLTVAPAPQPDLLVTDIAWSPAHPAAGDTTTFTATVRNVGNTSAGPFDVRFLLDNGTLSTAPVPGLAGGANVTVTSDPWSAVQGLHTVEAVADVDDEVAESNEANNRRQETLQVAAPPEADLVVTDIRWSPEDPAAGDTVSFTLTVKNQGDAAAGAFAVRFLLDNATLGTKGVDGLAAGASANVTSDAWTAIEGLHAIKGIADVHDDVPESHEANNERQEAFDVDGAPLPDLVVADVAWSPPAPRPGNATTFTAVVSNLGDAAAGPFAVRFQVDNVTLSTELVDSLAAGASVNVTSDPWTAAEGAHIVKVLADALDEVAESHEANNERQEALVVPEAPKPDLVVDDIAWVPANPAEGQAVVFTATVRNAGNATAGNFSLRFDVDDATLGTVPVGGGLAPGASVSVTSGPWPAVEGDHAVQAVADALGQVAESDEGNNARTEAVQVAAPPRPDLLVAAVGPDALVVLPFQEVQFRATVRNDGAAAGPFFVRFLLDGGVHLGDRLVEGLAEGASVEVVSDPWVAEVGNHTIRAVADARSEVTESDESNNDRAASFQVPAQFVVELHAMDDPPGGDRLPATLEAAPPSLPALLPADAQAAATAGVTIASLAALLYHRVHGPDSLRSATRRRIRDAVAADPGCTTGTVARRLGLSYKTAQHHVRVLRRSGVLVVLPGPQERFFLPGAMPLGELRAAATLRAEGARRIQERLALGPSGPRALARGLGLAPSTVAEHLARLQRAGLIVRLPGGQVGLAGPAPPSRGPSRPAPS